LFDFLIPRQAAVVFFIDSRSAISSDSCMMMRKTTQPIIVERFGKHTWPQDARFGSVGWDRAKKAIGLP